jgi:hypothetical protein
MRPRWSRPISPPSISGDLEASPYRRVRTNEQRARGALEARIPLATGSTSRPPVRTAPDRTTRRRSPTSSGLKSIQVQPPRAIPRAPPRPAIGHAARIYPIGRERQSAPARRSMRNSTAGSSARAESEQGFAAAPTQRGSRRSRRRPGVRGGGSAGRPLSTPAAASARRIAARVDPAPFRLGCFRIGQPCRRQPSSRAERACLQNRKLR